MAAHAVAIPLLQEKAAQGAAIGDDFLPLREIGGATTGP
jgi:hypothetical protein